jgi:hypothetical protein
MKFSPEMIYDADETLIRLFGNYQAQNPIAAPCLNLR